MNKNNNVFLRRFIVPLTKNRDAEISTDPKECMVYVLRNEYLFQKFISSHAVEKMNEKLGTWFIDEYETQYVELKDLPDMINLINEEIRNPLNKDILLYLKKCRDMMKIALEVGTFFLFNF